MASSITEEEKYKFEIITQVIKKEIKQTQAAILLRLSTRQIRRLQYGVQTLGKQAIIHKLKGKQSNHQLPAGLEDKALELVENKYADFKPTFASEKLAEIEAVIINPQTLRRLMAKKGLWKIRKQRGVGEYHSWRARKEYFGELEQFDGSYHFWFEKRFVDANGDPVEVCLLAAIDDAKGEITKAIFAANEGVIAVFIFWKEYIEEIGKPLNIYLDKFSTYKINHKSAVDNAELMTQFERAMKNLDTRIIPANSPQAKGRIERLFDTLQDRLVKELRLANINTPEKGNIFLREIFIPKFNKKFGVIPAKKENVHRPLSDTDKKHINRIFSIQKVRVVNNDFTIQFKNNWYQLAEIQPTTVRAKEKVLVEEWLDGTIHFSLKGNYLNYTLLPEKPKKTNKQPTILTNHKLNWEPSKDHPWKKGYKPQS
ncbi:MAG: ISNCY family transposase [Flavisolibacter sp.]